MTFLIKHQMQPCATSCLSTSIAMIAGVPVEGVVAQFHEDYRDRRINTRYLVDALDIPYETFPSVDEVGCDKPGVYLLCVPSLNIPANTHSIVLEIDETGEWALFDPAVGRADRRYYSRVPEGPDEEALGSFAVDAFISRDNMELLRGRTV